MKLLYIVTQGDMGGAQRSTLLLVKHFKGEIAAGVEKTELFEEARKDGIQTHPLKFLKRGVNPFYEIFAFFELYFLIKKIRPNIVHLNSSKAGFIGSIAGKVAGVKVIFTARGFVFNEPHAELIKSILILLEKFASLFRDQIITVSNADKQAAIKYNLINSKKITTIYNAIPKVEFIDRNEARKTLQIDETKFIIGTIANFYPTKGLDILIESAKLLPAEIKNKIQFVIIGSGPQEKNLKDHVSQIKDHGLFLFPGQIPNAGSLLSAFDLFVLPSRKEGFPLVLLEAMQAGLPIIATDVGGNKEAMSDAGIVVPSQDPQALASAIEKVYSNQTLRDGLKQKALQQAKKFDLATLFHQIESIYQKLL